MELVLVQLAIHVRVGEKNLCGTGFDNHVHDVRLPQFVEGLGGENHRCILFPPRLQRFDYVALNAWIPKERPRFINEERLEDVRDFAVGDDVIRAMEDIKQEWLKNLRVLLHALKIKALKTRKTHRVFGVVEKKPELSGCRPFLELQGEAARERIREHSQRAQLGVNAIKILDLLIKLPLFFERNPFAALIVGKDLDEE